MIANAGIAPMTDNNAWQDVIDVNLTGVYHTVDVAMKPMIKQGDGGAIVLTSSVAGLVGPIAADMIVSTIPAQAQTPELLGGLRADAVFEVRYDPWPTPIVATAGAIGATVVGGLDLLVHQAVEQVRLMTGIDDVPLAVMRAAGEKELAARAAG